MSRKSKSSVETEEGSKNSSGSSNQVVEQVLYCKCGERVVVRISETKLNSRRPFYACHLPRVLLAIWIARNMEDSEIPSWCSAEGFSSNCECKSTIVAGILSSPTPTHCESIGEDETGEGVAVNSMDDVAQTLWNCMNEIEFKKYHFLNVVLTRCRVMAI